MAPATASAASLINVATMAGPRTNEEKFIDIRWLSPADQPVRWLVGASMFEYESLSAQWFGYAGYLLGLEDELLPDRTRRHRPVQRLCNEPVAQLVIGKRSTNSIQPDVGSK